ncbi:hypothetical protein [Nocardioides sp. P5_E3]
MTLSTTITVAASQALTSSPATPSTAPVATTPSGGADAPANPADQNHRIKSDETLLRRKVTGTEKAAWLAEFRAILDWPGLYHLAAAIDGPPDDPGGDTRPRRRGRRSGYSAAILMFLVLAERVTGSRASALTELHEQAVWASLEETWNGRPENAARPFPVKAPNRDQVEHFRKRLSESAVREMLQERFQRIAVAQARQLGNFDPSTPVDWANPSLRHTIVGDGMVLKPFSDVIEIFDPVTRKPRYVGSRAAGESRGAGEVTDLTEDQKVELTGINHVILQTPTQYGPVVLATGYAPKAEVREALRLLDQVTDRLDGTAHSLLWDRIFTGWTLDYLLGRHRIRVFNKAVGANAKRTVKQPDEEDTVRAHQNWDAQEFMGRIHNNERFALRDANARPTRHLDPKEKSRLAKERQTLFAQWRNDELYQRYYSGESLPLGVCIYPATSSQHITGSRNQVHRKKVDVVRSKFHHFGERSHETASGTCTHDLYVDDDALHDVIYDGEAGCYVKIATATCVSSTPRKRRADLWGSTETWDLPCAHGAFRFTTEWDPHGLRRNPDSTEKYPAVDTVLSSLRPIARSQHQKFANFAHRRNDAESWNNWYQRRLPNYGRAASLTVGAQMLDLLAGGCVRNALTWAEWQSAD